MGKNVDIGFWSHLSTFEGKKQCPNFLNKFEKVQHQKLPLKNAKMSIFLTELSNCRVIYTYLELKVQQKVHFRPKKCLKTS